MNSTVAKYQTLLRVVAKTDHARPPENHGDEMYNALEDMAAEIERLEAKLRLLHTLIPCSVCGRGVRASYAVQGMCGECATKELRNPRKWPFGAA